MVQLVVTIPRDQKLLLIEKAQTQGLSLSDFVKWLIELNGNTTMHTESSALALKLRDIIESWQYENGSRELGNALEVTDSLIKTLSNGH